jgi:hypothetical protein
MFTRRLQLGSKSLDRLQLREHRVLIEAASILAAALLATVFIRVIAGPEYQDFEDLALGRETVAMYAAVDGFPIHCKGSEDAAACLAGHEHRGSRPVALWLGNSQLHAINQMRPGDETAPALLFRELGTRGVDLVAFSQPNANLQEHLVLLAALEQQLPLRFLILPVVFDDLRNDGVRTTVSEMLVNNKSVELLERNEIGRRIVASIEVNAKGELAALSETAQERSEAALTTWLAEHSVLWAQRPQARGRIVEFMMSLRNFVFGITAQTKRRMLPGSLEPNLAAVEAILDESRSASIECLIYVPPLRDDIETPYVEEEYESFKQEVERLAKEHGAMFANLEALVPAPLWGRKDSETLGGDAELDFMHFQAGGHRLLATAVGRILESRLEGANP